MSIQNMLSNLGQKAAQAFSNATGSLNQTFNPTTAKQFYAQQANAAFQSGNWGMASVWDAVGGYVAMGTGNPQSPGQIMWSLAFSVPSIGAQGAAKAVVSGVQFGMGFSSAISNSVTAISTGTPLNPMVAIPSLIGFAGSGMSAGAARLSSVNPVLGSGGQYFFSIPTSQALAQSRILSTASNAVSAAKFTFKAGQTVGLVAPQVGGVLFDHCADILTDIGEITGAYWDTGTQSLVLIGKESGTSNRLGYVLPAMDADHLKVALRAALAGQQIGVSIDPPANYRYGKRSAEMLPEGTPLVVSYLGGTVGTLFGAIMFEADRLMKCLSIGIHNQTRKPCTADVPGFRDLFQMHWNGDLAGGHSWHRFWFMIDQVHLKIDPRSSSLIFGDVRIKVCTELEMKGSAKGKSSDPNDEAFAQHLTEHYEEYAKEFPILKRLKELAKVSAIAKFLVNQKVSVDVGVLFSSEPIQVATPTTTPSILRADARNSHIWQMSGGVDMDKAPVLEVDKSGASSRLHQAASTIRPPLTMNWEFILDRQIHKAQAVSLATAASFQRKVFDHQFAVYDGVPPLSLIRVYDSRKLHRGNFGPGWRLLIPFSLSLVNRSSKQKSVLSAEEREVYKSDVRLLILNDHASGVSSAYRPIGGNGDQTTMQFGKITSQSFAEGQVDFHFDPSQTIELAFDKFNLTRSGWNYIFDNTGILIEMIRSDKTAVRYCWKNMRLESVENSASQRYVFRYRSAADQQVVEVKVSDGTRINYSYNEAGCLYQVDSDQQPQERYGYDIDSRLVEIRTSKGLIAHALYHDTGDLLASGSDQSADFAEGSITRKYNQGRVNTIQDEKGTQAEFSYGTRGDLRRIIVKNQIGRVWMLDYGSDGYLVRLTDPSGQIVKISNDQHGFISAASFSNKREWSVARNTEGDLTGIASPSGERLTYKCDRNGQIVSLNGSGGRKCKLLYDGGMLSGIKTPEYQVKSTISKLALGFMLHLPDGRSYRETTSSDCREVTYTLEQKTRQRTTSKDASKITLTGQAGAIEFTLDPKANALCLNFIC